MPGRPSRRTGLIAGSTALAVGAVALVGVLAWGPGGDSRGSGIPDGGSTSPPTQPVRPVPETITVSSPKLTWAPPTLTDPLTETVDAKHHSLKLDPARDYRVVLPTSADVVLKGGLSITGGHNVVIIGGIIAVPPRSAYPDKPLGAKGPDPATSRRAVYLKDQTGTIHIEGIRLHGDLGDGFNLDQRKGGIVQLENIRSDTLLGGKDVHHADVIQTWAGPAVLRVDGLVASTQYQGFFMLPRQHWDGGSPKEFAFRRTVITMMPASGYALWLDKQPPTYLDTSGLTIRLTGGRAQPNRLTWPDSRLGVKVIDDTTPVDLPGGTPGPGYISPGYVDAPSK